jgi:hypothetical protein
MTTVTLSGTGTLTKSVVDAQIGSATKIVIQGYIDIGYQAFWGRADLTSVSIPNSVTSIDGLAFWNCIGLTSLILPNLLQGIGYASFKNCAGLTSLILPSSLQYIGTSAFESCTGLTSFIVPNSVTSIGTDVFRDCSNLSSVTLSNSITRIESATFHSCASLTSLKIPKSVTSIGKAAFAHCISLISLRIPNSVISIGVEAFYNCTKLTAMSIPHSVSMSIPANSGGSITNDIGDDAFAESGLMTVDIANNQLKNIIAPNNNGIFFGKTNVIITNNTVTSLSLWSPRTCPADNIWNSVAYGNGVFVAVASTGVNRVMRSIDNGVTWSLCASVEANEWNSVVFGNGVFVAVASTGVNRVMRSIDNGVTWTVISVQANEWNSVAFGNGVFVAVASTGVNRVMRSSNNGVTWTVISVQANEWNSVTFGNGIFLAVASTGTDKVMGSVDGSYWNYLYTPPIAGIDNNWNRVIFGNGLFLAVASTGTKRAMLGFQTTTSWRSVKTVVIPENEWTSVAFGDGIFVAVASTGINRVMSSFNGEEWNTISSVTDYDYDWNNIYFANGVFVALAKSGVNRIMTATTSSPDLDNFDFPLRTYNIDPFTINRPMTNSSGNFNFESSNTTVASISGTAISIKTAGTTVIKATQQATYNYAASSITAVLKIDAIKASPKLKNFFDLNLTKIKTQLPFIININAPESLSVGSITYSLSDSAIGSVSGSTITIYKFGITTITATQVENGIYSSGTISCSLEVNQAKSTNIEYLSTQIMSYKNNFRQKVQDLVKIFLKDMDNTSYTNMKILLDSAHIAFGINNLLRIAVYTFDGTACYDSSSSEINSYNNFLNKTIGVIDVLFPEIKKCIVNFSGSAVVRRRDLNSGKVLKHKALCLKSSDNTYLGITYISTSVYTPEIL